MHRLAETPQPLPAVLRIGFLLSEAFDFYALANALKHLQQASDVAGHPVCQWQIMSRQGGALKANTGISTSTMALHQAQPFDVLVLCGDTLDPCTDDPGLRQQLSQWQCLTQRFGNILRDAKPSIQRVH